MQKTNRTIRFDKKELKEFTEKILKKEERSLNYWINNEIKKQLKLKK